MDWLPWLAKFWHYLVLVLTLVLSIWGSGHALLYRRDTRAAVVWVAFIWLAPLVGAVLYFLFGINRIKRRAALLRAGLEPIRHEHACATVTPDELAQKLPPEHAHLAALARTAGRVLARPLLPGNRLTPLRDGDAAYPEMLAAIAAAQQSVTLATYIFDHDPVGLEFVRALAAAVRRGVAVRVLIDAAGTRYSWPPITRELRRAGIPFARFLPATAPWRLLSLNLRNHRKLMVVDGALGFTGGLNLRAGHWLARQPAHPTRDLHFRVEGPVVAHLQEVFAEDWQFTTGETLAGPVWFAPTADAGPVIARGIADGPDEDFEKLRWTLLAALAAAQRSIRIATPYFLPDATLIAALNLAAMRGVTVEILLPAKSNLPFVDWASTAHWWQVLERGCQLRLGPPPFDHAKLMLVDDGWTLLGSANWDPRSLRLNFEFNLEAYDPALAGVLSEGFARAWAVSRPVTLAEVDARPLAVRLRDGVARLFTPFL